MCLQRTLGNVPSSLTRSFVFVCVFVTYQRKPLVRERIDDELSVQMAVPGVVWMNRHGSVTQHGLRTSCTHSHKLI